jgi:hypothetical protein
MSYTVVIVYILYRELRKICHLLYMDELKLLGRCEDELENERQIVTGISKDVNINCGLENCAWMCLKKLGH